MISNVVARVGDVLAVDVARLARARTSAARNGASVDRRYLDLLDAAERLETAFQALARVPVSPVVSTVDTGRKPLGSSDVARCVGLSVQAVRKAARTGRLSGTLTGEGWRFTRCAVDDWSSRRG